MPCAHVPTYGYTHAANSVACLHACIGRGDSFPLARFEAAHAVRRASSNCPLCLPACYYNRTRCYGFGTGAANGSAWNSCVVCDAATHSRVVGVALTASGLRGTIPDEVCSLAALESLVMTKNKLSGGLPSCIGQLATLRTLQLSSNALVGRVPESIGQLRLLADLQMQTNKLSGPIPTGICQLSSLTYVLHTRTNVHGTHCDSTRPLELNIVNGCCLWCGL